MGCALAGFVWPGMDVLLSCGLFCTLAPRIKKHITESPRHSHEEGRVALELPAVRGHVVVCEKVN